MPVYKIVNGEQVAMTAEEEAAYNADVIAINEEVNNPEKKGKRENEEKILNRRDKVTKAYALVMTKLNNNNTANFVQSTRNERVDYPYSKDALVEWITTTFPTKGYFDAELQTKLLNILS